MAFGILTDILVWFLCLFSSGKFLSVNILDLVLGSYPGLGLAAITCYSVRGFRNLFFLSDYDTGDTNYFYLNFSLTVSITLMKFYSFIFDV